MKKTFNQTMPCAVRLAALLLVPAVCVAFFRLQRCAGLFRQFCGGAVPLPCRRGTGSET